MQPKFRAQYRKMESLVDGNDYEYDYESTMHYGPLSYAIDRTKPVMSVKPPSTGMFRSFQSMSDTDYKSLRDWYGCGESKFF